jgi:quinoprotein glucose dehydrogenase
MLPSRFFVCPRIISGSCVAGSQYNFSLRPRNVSILVTFCCGLFCQLSAQAPGKAFRSAAEQDWPAYGGSAEDIRYSTLKQINRSNVSQLELAWTYDTMDGPGATQTEPIVIHGVLFGVTPKHKIIALDAASGKLLWKFDSGIAGRGPNRGVVYWASGTDERIFGTVQSYLYALDAHTGLPIKSFGQDGRIDLREGLGRDPAKQSIVPTSPGIVYKDLLIVGERTPEALPAPPGDIRAYDVRSGAMRWIFHTIPHPGEYGYDTWPKDAWTYSGAANNWAGMALDQKRGIVYVPTGSAASDFYGADRLGDDLFANCLLALDANTGRRIWHFQGVHHDLWDRDFPSPPNLVTVNHNGRRIDAVAQTTKHGWVYLFDRANGKPLFPIEEKSYPPSTTPGEIASKTQPLPLKPKPYARQILTEDMLTNRTPEAHQWALEQFRTFRSEGQFVPFSVGKDTIIFPGFDGGSEWGGSAADPQTGILYVNANDLPWTGRLVENTGGNTGKQVYLNNCGTCHGDSRAGAPPQIPSLINIGAKLTADQMSALIRQGAGRMPSFPNLSQPEVDAIINYLLTGEDKELQSGEVSSNTPRPKYRFGGYHRFLDPDGYPAVGPPWGTLNAINLNTGEYAWRVPLGEYPELAEKGMKDTGTENYGGPIVTAGGLVFIGATNFDKKFRAFDKQTGKLLWETTLPLAGNATPTTYMVGGRQYVVIYATGGYGRRGLESGRTSLIAAEQTSGVYVAFALPKQAEPGR